MMYQRTISCKLPNNFQNKTSNDLFGGRIMILLKRLREKFNIQQVIKDFGSWDTLIHFQGMIVAYSSKRMLQNICLKYSKCKNHKSVADKKSSENRAISLALVQIKQNILLGVVKCSHPTISQNKYIYIILKKQEKNISNNLKNVQPNCNQNIFEIQKLVSYGVACFCCQDIQGGQQKLSYHFGDLQSFLVKNQKIIITQIILINSKEKKVKNKQLGNIQKMRNQKPITQLSSSTPDFIRKLYNMIELSPQIISFSDDGVEVLIHNQYKFQQEILPTFFRHSNWRSFVRQMNMYNFRKINRVNKTFIFINQHFKQGNQQHYDLIKRKVNPKEQQSQIEKDYQSQLRSIIANQCQNLCIPNNPLLLNSLHTINHCNSNDTHQSIASSITIPSLILTTKTHSQPLNSSQPNSQLKIQNQIKHENQYNNIYINSLTYFIDNIIIYKHRTEQILEELNNNVEKIVKQRKILENKNILNSFKDSLQMIDEVKNKLENKIQNYIVLDYKNNDDNTSQKNYKNHQNYLNYYLNHSQENKKTKNHDQIHYIENKQQPIIPQIRNGNINGSYNCISPQHQHQHHSKSSNDNQLNRIKSFNSSSNSINLIITQPTPNNDNSQYAKMNKGKKLIEIKKEEDIDELIEQPSENNMINMGIHNSKSFYQIPNINSSNVNGSKYNNNNVIKNKGNNGLGLSSLCSFTSVTHLLNFDKE